MASEERLICGVKYGDIVFGVSVRIGAIIEVKWTIII